MLGQRLRLARKKADFSMRELAERLFPPITAQAVSKYEAGRMMPSSAVLIGLGRTLEVSLDFLTGSQVEALTGIEFRKHSGTSARDRARAEAIVSEQLEDYLTIEDILEIPPPADPFGDIRCDHVGSFDEVEDKAGALRRRWDLGLDPVPSVIALLEDRGIRVVAADLPARCDGLAYGVTRGGNRPSIAWPEMLLVPATPEGKDSARRHTATRVIVRLASTMDEIAPWLTPALIIALFTWLQRDMRELRHEMNERFKDINKRLGDEVKTLTTEMHQRFDQVTRELGEHRERMAKLEGSLEGFLAGRRDRDAA